MTMANGRKIKVVFREGEYKVRNGISVLELIEEQELPVKNPVAAVINGHAAQLSKHIKSDSTLDIVELETYQGQRIYESSVLFLFSVAFAKRFPEMNVFIQHSFNQGIYAEVKERPVTEEEVESIEKLMKDLVLQERPIKRMVYDWDIAQSKMKELGRQDLINLFRYYSPAQVEMYELDGVEECLYLPLLPNTKYLQEFRLKKYQDGMVIMFPDYEKGRALFEFRPITKLFNTYKEHYEWTRILKIRTVGQLNKYIMNNAIEDLILVSESFHEKRVAKIADEITGRKFIPKVVLIAGPSSSGKTTFSKRLDMQLRVNGLRPVAISLDNYFLERAKTPKDKEGNYDFESLNAIDVPLFGDHLSKLLRGEEVDLPVFDFRTGTRHFKGEKFALADDQIIIIEGIHGINPKLTGLIEDKFKYKIYVSALTQLNLHRHDRVPTADTRLLRRIVRDSNFRGYSGNQTLLQWRHVRVGETVNVFPFQEEADSIFNSALFYELAVLKVYAERELLKVERSHPMYPEAQRLLAFLSFFLPLESLNVPKTSIVREFIGGSSFKY
ncbi:MAG: nucleoside kinase [Oligoflexia bacterium]|nr:nucleoside kinase [Oligoflexia bacterium]